MTERARGHQSSAYSPSVIQAAETVSGVVCGEDGAHAILGFGLAVMAYDLLIVLPLMVAALQLLKQARQEGGCSECAAPMQHAVIVTVPPRGPPRPNVVMRDPKVPLAQAVPITQPTAVRVARGEMH